MNFMKQKDGTYLHKSGWYESEGLLSSQRASNPGSFSGSPNTPAPLRPQQIREAGRSWKDSLDHHPGFLGSHHLRGSRLIEALNFLTQEGI